MQWLRAIANSQVLERGRAPEPLQAAGGGEERLLEDVLRVFVMAAEAAGEPIHPWLVLLQQRLEGLRVPERAASRSIGFSGAGHGLD